MSIGFGSGALPFNKSITAAAHAAGRPDPRVVAGLLVCVTADEDTVRARIADQFGVAGQVPEYRAVLDRDRVAEFKARVGI